MYHAFSLHRRPVYRHENGDIAINTHFIVGLIEGHLAVRMDPERRASFYSRLMIPIHETLSRDNRDRGIFVSAGVVPELTRRGIRYLNSMMHTYGDMIADVGVIDASGKFTLPEKYDHEPVRLHS